MAIRTLTAVATGLIGGGTTKTPSGSTVEAILSDGSLASFVTLPPGGTVTSPLSNYTLLTNERPVHAVVNLTHPAGTSDSVGRVGLALQTVDVTFLPDSSTSKNVGNFGLAGYNQALLDGLTVGISNVGATDPISIAGLTVDVYTIQPPAAPTISTPGAGTIATRVPAITWIYNANAADNISYSLQSHYQVRIFTAAQAAIGGFDPATSPATHEVSALASGVRSWTPPPLVNGTSYVIYVRTANSPSTVWSPWSSRSITVTVVNTPPTAVIPANGSTISTSRPVLGASTTASGVNLRREWQFAANAGFTTFVFSLLEPGSGALAPSDPIPWPVPDTSPPALTQGTRYVRARVLDADGIYSAYSAANTFVVSHPPTTTGRSPSGGGNYNFNAGTVFLTWIFSDPYPQDFQTRYEVELWKANDPVDSRLFSGVVVDGSGGHQFTGLDSSWKDTELRWRVRVWDSDLVDGPWSGETAFYLRDVPVVSITFPGNGAEINTSQPLVTWNYSSASDMPQQQWKVDIITSGNVVATSGWVTSAASSWQCPTPAVQIGPTYQVAVTVIDSVGLQGTDTNTFTADYVAPEPPDFSVDSTTYQLDARRHLDWSGATAEAGFYSWRVYRRLAGGSTWVMLAEIGEVTTRTYDDYTGPSQVAVEYTVTQVVENFGSLVESVFVPSSQQLGTLYNYLLVCPEQPELGMTLWLVKGDNFGDDQEQATIDLLGRGRRFEYGTRFGISGTLDLSLRDRTNQSARDQRIAIEALRNSGLRVYMLNPFGDVLNVAMSSLSITRTPGVGLHEMVEVTMGYTEVGEPTDAAAVTSAPPPPIPVTMEAQWGGLMATASVTPAAKVLTGNFGAMTATAVAGQVVNEILVPYGNKLLMGATPAQLSSTGASLTGLNEWEALGLPTPHIYHLYLTNADEFFSATHRSILERPGKDRMIAKIDWKPSTSDTWAAIAAGSQDARLDQAALEMIDYGKMFFLTFHHEPDNDTITAGNGNTDYADMFAYCVTYLRNAGVTNAVFVWTMTGYAGNANRWDDMYPGDQYVDWFAYNPYAHSGYANATNYLNYMTGAPGSYTGSNPPFLGFYNWATLKSPGKPIMLSEWGIGGDCNNGLTVMNGMAAVLISTFPAIKAVVYWNDANASNNEKVVIAATGGTAGNFRFNWDGSFATLNYNSSASAAQTAIRAMSSILGNVPAGSVNVTGGPLNSANLVVEFRNGLRAANLAAATISNSTVVGATPTVSYTGSGLQGNAANNYMLQIDQPEGGTRPSGLLAATINFLNNSIFDIDTALIP